MVRRTERLSSTSEELVAARRRMEERLIAGRAPQRGDLKTLWEAYQAAVVEGRAWGENRLPDDLVADLKAAHDAMVRELREQSAS
jgi:hypothetical protein